MKKILVPTDFSDCANFATKCAIEMAPKLNCGLEFLHIISTPIDWVKIPKNKEQLYPEILQKIGRAKNELKALEFKSIQQGIVAKHSLIFNIEEEDIVDYINVSEYELIVIGSHGSSGIKERFIGSNTQKVIRNSFIPVLVIKNKPNESITNAVFVSDFEDVSKEDFVKISTFTEKLNINLKLLYVKTATDHDLSIESKMDELLAFCDNQTKYSKYTVNADSIENGIQYFAKTENIDMVCICTHGKSGVRQLFSPSIAESIANHCKLPLLSVKLQNPIR